MEPSTTQGQLRAYTINNGFFTKKFVLFLFFFSVTPLVLGISLISLILLTDSKEKDKIITETQNNVEMRKSGVQLFASLPASAPKIESSIQTEDARPEIIRKYLEKYNSPIADKAEFIVETADKYGLDFRLITAIAQQESNLCKRIPPGTHNCWGWGIHSRGTLGFSSYEEAIVTVSQGLRSEYLDKGYLTVDEIMLKYTPLSPGTWAQGVRTFMQEMQ